MIEHWGGNFMTASATRGAVFQQIDRLYRDGTLAGLGDGQLLERYLSGRDEAAFEALVNLHGPMVLGLCRRVLRDPRDIEDAFQATFMILARKAPAIRDRGLLSNWLYGVAYRVARRARSQTLRRRDREMAVENLEAVAPTENADALGLGPVLDQELNRLPGKYRAVLVLCYLKGHTHDQAAEELECPVGTVRSRLARGRDLLRRRLTSRGHAPTAAILGADSALPAKLFVEAVPPSLASATVRVAFAVGASQTIEAGAISASALALTQGVLTTMKFAQLKYIAAAIVATSLAAGGIIAVSSAAGQGRKEGQDGNRVEGNPGGPQETTIRAPLDGTIIKQPGIEARLTALQKQLDELLSRSTPISAGTTPKAEDPSLGVKAPLKPDGEQGAAVNPARRSIRELEVELHLAIAEEARNQLLYERQAISSSEREKSRGRVLLIKARLDGLDDELIDDLDRLKLEVKKKKAEIDQAAAEMEVASTNVTRNQRLNDKQAGGVSAEYLANAEAQLKSMAAHVNVKKVELEEVDLRVQQLERRRHQIQQVVKLAGFLQKAAPPANSTAVPGVPGSR
jgi:RNA polymerase sigma factor (sigma-70 family)